MLAAGIGDVLTTEMGMANEPESAKADRLIEERMGQDEPATEIVIVRSSTFTAQDEPFRRFVGALATDIRDLPTTAQAVSFYDTRYTSMVSDDGHTVLVSVDLVGDADAADQNVTPLLEVIDRANESGGFEVMSAVLGSISRTFSKTSGKTSCAVRRSRSNSALHPHRVRRRGRGWHSARGRRTPIVVTVGATAVIGRAYELNCSL
jgi:hypothetical protein